MLLKFPYWTKFSCALDIVGRDGSFAEYGRQCGQFHLGHQQWSLGHGVEGDTVSETAGQEADRPLRAGELALGSWGGDRRLEVWLLLT